MSDTLDYINKPLSYVQSLVPTVRVVKNNGHTPFLTEDHNPGRLSVEVTNGVVTNAYWG